MREAYDIEVEYVPFPLHPEIPPEGMTLEELFEGQDFDLEGAKAQLAEMLDEEGLPYGEWSDACNTRLAQELARWGESQPGGDALHDALFRAYFVDGINLARVDELVRIAAAVGLPEEEARRALEERSFREVVESDWRRAMKLGVEMVPSFVLGEFGSIGAQPYENLERLVTRAGVELR